MTSRKGFARPRVRSFAALGHRLVLASIIAATPALAVAQARGGGGVNPDPRELERLFNTTGVRLSSPTDPLAGPVVTDAPFSADATTTVTQILGDGTRIERSASARFYRDRTGRVRREQTILGLDALNTGGSAQTITVLPNPSTRVAYTLDPSTRTARRAPPVALDLMAFRTSAGTVFVRGRTGGPQTTGNSPPVEESLGNRQIEGVKVIGRKTTSVVPVGEIGNDRPIEITDERWESPELRMLIYSRSSDPRTGVVEYKLTNINRSEPPADLFVIPSDYTVNEPPPGGRTGGRGAREGGPGPTGR